MHSALPVPVPVVPQGWTITSYLTLGLNILFGTGMLGALGVWLKTRPETLKANLSAEERLRDDLMGRVAKLEADGVAAAALLEAERARHEAEMRIMRHRVNNSDQCLDALLLLLKTAPDKVQEAVSHIESLRARQKEEIALEKGAQAGAKVAGAPIVSPAA